MAQVLKGSDEGKATLYNNLDVVEALVRVIEANWTDPEPKLSDPNFAIKVAHAMGAKKVANRLKKILTKEE